MEIDSNWLLFIGIVLAGVIFLVRSKFLKTPSNQPAQNQAKHAGTAGKQTGNSTLNTSRSSVQRSSSAHRSPTRHSSTHHRTDHHRTDHHHYYDDNDSKPFGGGNICSPGGDIGGSGGGDSGGGVSCD
ncbi:hypothetical protein MKR81_27055 (plasmid) [Vibrio campbellii]|uniref:hypothetical protein n=1 Tax=Vibrio campbellii TaxID=680 RepID=UPI001F0817E1|nr:hypothetical protein [Vibrio campbellii]UMM06610.1 hypothetical protein MKR81_27055 [Vibrio campbellii]